MSNASRCQKLAAHYARLASEAVDMEEKLSYRRLERLWRDIAPLAENFDRLSDPLAKERIYEMVDAVAEHRRKVA